MNTRSYDYVVLGSGIAGLTFALHAANHASVAVICKASLCETNTAYAQGGIAAVLSSSDSFEQHVQDTLLAGGGLCNEDVVRFIVEQAPQSIKWLQQQGVCFDAASGHKLKLGLEGGHSHSRIVHVKDSTGLHVQQVLGISARQHKNIQVIEYCMGLDLLLSLSDSKKRCIGVEVVHLQNGFKEKVYARAVVLATGGAGQVYRHTTNPIIATGDGLAMAARACAAIENMEFFQFHPTALYEPGATDTFLISEALRGAGAELVLPDGKKFMQHYHRQGSLAPRDVVARAVFHEMCQLHSPCLYLDARSLPEKHIRDHFPLIYSKCKSIGIDPEHDLIPVVPAAHYQCGGVATDKYGRTTVQGLYAIGEVACSGIHGANRLASNSLLEGLVIGKSAASKLASIPHDAQVMLYQPGPDVSETALLETSVKVTSIINRIREIMWEKAGIVRISQDLIRAQQELQALKLKLQVQDITVQVVEATNLLTVAELILSACLDRKESVGGHYLMNEQQVLEQLQ